MVLLLISLVGILLSLGGLFLGNLGLDVSLLHLRLRVLLFFGFGLGLLGRRIRIQWVISGGLSFCRFFFLFGFLGLRVLNSGVLRLVVDQIIEYFDILFMLLVSLLTLLLLGLRFLSLGPFLVISGSLGLFVVFLLCDGLQFLLFFLKLLLLDQELALHFVLLHPLFGLLGLFGGLFTLSGGGFSAVHLVLDSSGCSSVRTSGGLVRFGHPGRRPLDRFIVERRLFHLSRGLLCLDRCCLRGMLARDVLFEDSGLLRLLLLGTL